MISVREKRVSIIGSPIFEVKPTITANDVFIVDYSNTPPYSKYAPLDYSEITNNTTSDILIEIGGIAKKTILKGSIATFKDVNIHQIRITELSGIAITGGLSIVSQKKPLDTDRQTRQEALKPKFTLENILKTTRGLLW